MREYKIKSYPTVLLFNGKDRVELKSSTAEELNKDLTRTLGVNTPADGGGRNDKNALLERVENAVSPDTARGDGMQELEVTDPH